MKRIRATKKIVYKKAWLPTVMLLGLVFLSIWSLFPTVHSANGSSAILATPVAISEFTVDTSTYTKVNDFNFSTTTPNIRVFVKSDFNVEMQSGTGVQEIYVKAIVDEGTASETVLYDQKVRSTQVINENGAVTLPFLDTTIANVGTHNFALYFKRVGNGSIRVHNLDLIIGKTKTEDGGILQLTNNVLSYSASSSTFAQVANFSFSKSVAGPIFHEMPHTVGVSSMTDPSYSALNLVGLWRLNGNANDSSSSGNNGTITGATSNATGGFNGNGTYLFDGNDYISGTSGAELQPNTTVSVSAWVKASDVSGTRTIFAHNQDPPFQKNGYVLRINAGKAEFGALNNSGVAGIVASNKTLSANVWYHLVGTYNASSSLLSIYIDGTLDNTKTHTGNILYKDTGWAIGRNGDRNEFYFNGYIDEVSVWSKTLSLSEVGSIYEKGFLKYEFYATDTVSGISSPVLSRTIQYGSTGSISDLWYDSSTNSSVNMNVYAKVTNGVASISGKLHSFELKDSDANTIAATGNNNSGTNGVTTVQYTAGSHKLANFTHTIQSGTDLWVMAALSIRLDSSNITTPKIYVKENGASTNCSEKLRTLTYYHNIGNIAVSCQISGKTVGNAVTLELWMDVPTGAQISVMDEYLLGVDTSEFALTEVSTPPTVSIIYPSDGARLKGVSGYTIAWDASDPEGDNYTSSVTFNGSTLASGLSSTVESYAWDLSATPEGGPYDLVVESCETSPLTHCGSDTHQIYVDNSAPSITITAPTKTANADITNTTVRVTDNQQLSSSNVSIHSSTTASTNSFSCIQTSSTQVDCTLTITSSGNLVIAASDIATNSTTNSETGYVIDAISPVLTITAPTKASSATITNTTIRATDNAGITAANVTVNESSTAGTNSFNCTQTSSTQVDCTINISSSGDLDISASDDLSNSTTASETGYSIDANVPSITFSTPTLISNATITDTTIQATDSSGITAANVTVDGSSTAGTSGLNCLQTSGTQVDCSINITSTGTLVISAIDDLTNATTASRSGYVIETTDPSISFSAPTKVYNATITDTTIQVTDDTGISSANVTVDGSTTAGTSGYSCIQTSGTQVDCTISITSSGNLTIAATDNAGNSDTGTESSFIIDTTDPVISITAPTKSSNAVISNTTIQVTDNNGILTANVTVDSSSTSSTTNFACSQTSSTQVDCTVDVVNSGNLVIAATDNATNSVTQTESNYFIENVDPTITITAPTKSSNSTITDTTIRVTDNYAITASNVTVDTSSTANTSSLNCVQTSGTQIDCTINVNGSGNLVIKAIDNLTNSELKTESSYNVDSNAPSISFTAPKKQSDTSITDTTIRVTDSTGILSSNVTVDDSTTAGTANFSCTQTSSTQVDCTIDVTSSGMLVIAATDDLDNATTASESGYSIVLPSVGISIRSSQVDTVEQSETATSGQSYKNIFEFVDDLQKDNCLLAFKGHWARTYAKDILDKGLFPIFTDDELTCNPNAPVRRGDFIAWIIVSFYQDELNDFDSSISTSTFLDIDTDNLYAPYLIIAENKKIVSGYPDGRFKVNRFITRSEMLKIVVEIYGGFNNTAEDIDLLSELYPASDPIVNFEDITSAEPWYYGYLFFAKSRGFFEGRIDPVTGGKNADLNDFALFSETIKFLDFLLSK